MRTMFGSGTSPTTIAITSTLDASTCPRDEPPTSARTIVVRRGSTDSSVIRSSGQNRRTTQSPVQGPACASAAISASSAPDQLARTGPSSVKTVARPLSTRATRPGTRSSGTDCRNSAVELSSPRA